ncbi:MAG: phosphotransferase family protein [Pseudomonadales bacterium]
MSNNSSELLPEQSLSAWLAKECDINGAKIDAVLAGGNSNLTLKITSDQGPFVLRTPPADTISPKAYRGIEREAIVMRALHGHVRVPEVICWCDDNSVIGRPFLLVSLIDGVSISDTLPAAYSNNSDSINSLGEQLIDELALIHQVPWQDIGLESFGNPDNYLRRQIERWLKIRESSGGRELPDIERIGQWLLEHLPESAPVGIVHGDYHLDNTLSHPTHPSLAAVIDWELSTIGDPLTDLGLLLMFWGERKVNPPGFAHVQAVTRIEGVHSRQDLAARWSAATEISIQHLDFYMCFAFWRLAAIVEGAYQLYQNGTVDTEYAKGLEWDVPALLQEAAMAAQGEW